jgi:hypothetical protein
MATRPVIVETTATEIAPYNNRRTVLSMYNNGTADIFVSQDQTNITSDGYTIAVGGALDLVRALGDEPETQWFGAVATATQNLRVLEQFGELPDLLKPPSLPSRTGER